MFGVLGLAAKGAVDETTVVVRTKDGEPVYFAIRGWSPEQSRAVLTPLLNYLKVPFYHEDAPGEAPRSLATELRELAALRDEGLLTETESNEQKARLLNPPITPPPPPG